MLIRHPSCCFVAFTFIQSHGCVLSYFHISICFRPILFIHVSTVMSQISMFLCFHAYFVMGWFPVLERKTFRNPARKTFGWGFSMMPFYSDFEQKFYGVHRQKVLQFSSKWSRTKMQKCMESRCAQRITCIQRWGHHCIGIIFVCTIGPGLGVSNTIRLATTRKQKLIWEVSILLFWKNLQFGYVCPL